MRRRVKQVDVVIRVIVDGLGTPLPSRPFSLTALPSAGAQGTVVTGMTDDQGYVRAKVPKGATAGTLVIKHVEDDGTQTDVWSIELEFEDHLGGADTVAGAQARLTNLGLQPGGDDGNLDATTQRAINRFRALEGLPVICPPGPEDPTPNASTLLDSDTVNRLVALYEGQNAPPSSSSGSSGSQSGA